MNIEIAEVNLKQLRETVDADQGSDPEMLKFVMDTSELPEETKAIITINNQFVTYAVLKDVND